MTTAAWSMLMLQLPQQKRTQLELSINNCQVHWYRKLFVINMQGGLPLPLNGESFQHTGKHVSIWNFVRVWCNAPVGRLIARHWLTHRVLAPILRSYTLHMALQHLEYGFSWTPKRRVKINQVSLHTPIHFKVSRLNRHITQLPSVHWRVCLMSTAPRHQSR